MPADMYLGRTTEGDLPFSLPPEALRTHGVVVGMTGSGKTGMALVLLEELVQAGVPVIAIDPKGDLGNLGLLFPEARGADLAPWLESGDPAEVARAWQAGLAEWGLGPERVAALKQKLALTLYTPGSDSGVSVDVLASLRRPDEALLADDEGRLALVSDTISGLLGLVDHPADPVKDPAHIVLSTILDAAWRDGQDADLETLLLRLVDPPFKKVGVFPVDAFFPPKERMALAMKLNGVIASPTFQAWTRGIPMDFEALLQRGDRTRVSVFCLAHLSDSERQFFLSLLLGRLLAWTRTRPGTEKLRAVLFFDEVAGYLPPHPADPPTKRPLLTLMKQARAMGLGVVLATQNPVDVDYKGLSNAGLWAIGRLRTAQDRERVLAGLPGRDLDHAIAGLEKRQFLLALASGQATVIRSRHAMCWLRGPFTRLEISQLRKTDLHTDPPGGAPKAARAVTPAATAPTAPSAPPPPAADGTTAAPTAGDIPQLFLDPSAVFSVRLQGRFTPWAEPARPDGATLYRPALYASLAWTFNQASAGFSADVEQHRVWFPLGRARPEQHHALPLQPDDVSEAIPEGASGKARFAHLPEWMDEPREIAALQKEVVDEVFRTETAGLFTCPPLKLTGRNGESAADFRARCEEAINDRVDEAVADLREKYEAREDRLRDKLRQTESKLREAQGTLSARQAEEAVGVGETLLSWFTGRRKSLSAAATNRRQTTSASTRVDAAAEAAAELRADMEALEGELAEEMEAIRAVESRALDAIVEKEIRLKKSDITVRGFGILWIPVTRRLGS